MVSEHEHRELTIETLRSPPINIEPAPLPIRIAAGLIDSVVISALWGLIALATGSATTNLALVFPEVAYLAILTFIYFSMLEGFFAASVGKLALRLRVLGIDGDPCSLTASLKRNLLRFVDWLPFFYILGGIAILLSSKKQRIGDRIAGTIVTRAPQRDVNPPPAPFLFH